MRKLVTSRRVLLALIFLIPVSWFALRNLPDGRLHVWFLDVGQGDAILIQTPDGRQILVDGGPSPSALLDQLGEVLPFWDRTLNVVVLTHPDADHLSGLIPLFEHYRVATVVDSVAAADKAAAAWLAAWTTADAPHWSAAAGMRVAVGPAVLTVLSPPAGDSTAESNSRSVVLRLDYGESSLLLTGDAEADAEENLLRAGAPLAATVLKVAHHGSDAGTSSAFLAAVQPQLAIISVGADNRFGHPAPGLLERLRGVQVLRTDLDGRIELVSDSHTWRVRTER